MLLMPNIKEIKDYHTLGITIISVRFNIVMSIIIIILSICAVGYVRADCTSLLSCFNSLTSIANLYTGTLTSSVLDAECSGLTTVSACITAAGCTDPTIEPVYQGLANAFNYICTSTNKQIIIQNVQCLSSVSLNNAVLSCQTTYQSAQSNTDVSAAVYCSTIQTFVTCTSNAVYAACGAAVARLVGNVAVIELQPAVTQAFPSCTIGQTRSADRPLDPTP